MTAVGISSRWEPENSRNVTWIYLPASKGQIERAMQRSGIADPKDMRLFIADSSFPEEVDVALDFQCDNIHELNELALVVEKFSIHDRKKLGAAVSMAKPENASQIRRLAENMDLFEFAPGAHTPEEYGKYMIQRSGHFEYDPNLDEFYDYERYGLQHMDYQSGVFTDRGYIAYVGTVDLEELMRRDLSRIYFVYQNAMNRVKNKTSLFHCKKHLERSGSKCFFLLCPSKPHLASLLPTLNLQNLPNRSI